MTEENRRLEHILVIMSFGFCVIIFVFLHQIDIAELNKKSKVKLAVILATVIAMLLGLLIVLCYVRRRRRKLRGNTSYDPHRFTHFDLCYMILSICKCTKSLLSNKVISRVWSYKD